MPRLNSSATFFVVLAAGALLAAGPLGGAREAAKNTRAAAEGASERTAQVAQNDQHRGHPHAALPDEGHEMLVPKAIAVVMPTEGSGVTGRILFEQTDEGVKVTAEVSGLKPDSKHGFHVHEFGDVSSADGSAAGGHYNPEGHDHALPDSDGARHAGDFGNLEADGDGNASYEATFENITIAGKKNPILGRAVIVHANPDDGGQPVGNAGGRIAQGVVGVAE